MAVAHACVDCPFFLLELGLRTTERTEHRTLRPQKVSLVFHISLVICGEVHGIDFTLCFDALALLRGVFY
jgi:hypothetical protein